MIGLLRRSRGLHRLAPGRPQPVEIAARWAKDEEARRILHRVSLRRRSSPEPVFLGSREFPVRFWQIGSEEPPEGLAGTLTIGLPDQLGFIPAVICDPCPVVPELSWDEEGRLFADGQEINLSPVEQKLLKASIVAEDLRLLDASLDSTGEILDWQADE